MKKFAGKNQVVILGGGTNALGIIRSFERTSIPVIAMSWYHDYGMSSRFCRSVLCPDPLDSKKLVDFLVNFGKSQAFKPVLFATSDLFLMPVIENKTILEEYFHIPVCDWEILRNLIKKEYLYSLSAELGIPCPKTKIITSNADLNGVMDGLSFPVIVKPSVNINFSNLLGSKAFIVKDQAELDGLIASLLSTNLCEEKLVFQEYIPGDTTSLYTITSYADQNFDIRAYSIGHKIRQFPPQTGTIISGKVTHVEAILNQAREFVKATRFYGISNIEFKKDLRDGSYKLMEINPRTGVWNLSVLRSGINLPLMAYNDILGHEVTEESNKTGELVWMITPLDLYYSIRGFKSKGFPEFKISFREWCRSVKGKKVDACFVWYDPIPFIKGLIKKFA